MWSVSQPSLVWRLYTLAGSLHVSTTVPNAHIPGSHTPTLVPVTFWCPRVHTALAVRPLASFPTKAFPQVPIIQAGPPKTHASASAKDHLGCSTLQS